MLRRIRGVSSVHAWRMGLSTSPSRFHSLSSNPTSSTSHAEDSSLRVLKVYLYHEPKTYWTFAVEESLKVGTVLAQLADKLSTKNLTLFSRTKSRLGRRTDKMLEPSESLFELSEKYKKKKKPYQLFVHVANTQDQVLRTRSIDRMSAPPSRFAPSLDLDLDTDAPDNRSNSSTPRLSTSHSAPLYLESNEEEKKTPPAGSPRLVQQPPKEAGEVLFSNNNSLQRSLSQNVANSTEKGTFVSETTGSSFFRQGSVYGYISTPPNNSSVHARLDLPGGDETAKRKPVRRRITDISSASTPPTPANSLKPRDVAPIDRASFFMHRSADDVVKNNTTFPENHDPFHSLPAKPAINPALDTLIIIRLYASNNCDMEGPCWTLAVAPRTKAREACSIIESQLGIAPESLRVCTVDALGVNSKELKEERKITNDEKLLQVRDEWLKRGRIPYFFLREQSTSLLVKDLPRRPLSSPDMRARRHAFESDDYRKELTAIYLGGNKIDSFNDPCEPPSPVIMPWENPDTIDSSAWVMEYSIKEYYSPRPHIDWIPSHELEKVHKVGDGGYAKVYKTRYKDKFVAVKTLKGVATKDQMESFRKEFEVLSLTTSPYLIHFYGASIDESNPERPVLSIVVEYCERGTLYKALNNKTLEIDWQTCFKWIHQTLHGILYLHHMTPQMVHRDIKSLNLLLDSKWNVKVADFGLSRSMSMTNKTSLSMMKGTIAYCAPEMHNSVQGTLFTPKSDAYSIAIVMWEVITRCMTGRYIAPYSEYPDIYHEFQIMFLTANQNRRPTIPPKTPEALKELLEQCWVGNPDERLSCDEILLQIQSIYVQYQTEKIEWESRRQIV